ncbi:AGC/PKA protein kinase [Trichoderma gamsii]|uniref:AGC/PKA protein kinase n=1 Tax=Trichoderma gamsii TaxID=398673 RepID=A0A2P4ZWC8_9HYPO|nr:AGC/PKA protein kinase [Trichoderma gamsii]PON28597.1 AGC/PKA protein kinase [Trichoderma gamsii]
MPQPDDYTVGWICAIRTEYVTARAFLDEEHEGPTAVSPNDNNAYTLGKIWGHNVVIAVLPDGEYGTSSAASVARDMMHSFCNVRIGLMVGIGGGAPSQRHDIRLGDVVVSAPRDGKGGVFQYDFGKTIQDQSFKPTGFLNQPPAVLRTAMTVLSGQYESDGHGLEGDINNILLQKKRLQKAYSRPHQSLDRLYRSDVVHPRYCDNCSAICSTDVMRVALRPERTEDEDNPAIHYGIIASGNQLMKDALLRDKLAAEEDILCFEMEAAGLMNHFPCLVIRGICDYSDSHKSKEWQGYAAMTAAAYAKDLLRRIAPNRIEAEKKISEVLSGVQQSIDEVIQVQHDQANKDFLDWLTPIEYGPQHSDFFNRREPGTGQWFLGCDEYQTWLDSHKNTLFCPGIPGSGKTILTAIVINDLITRFGNDPTIGIAYIYFNFRQKDEQKIEYLMASLLKQLARSQSFPESVKDLFSQHKERRTRLSTDEISKALQVVATMYSKVFIIVDALDECQPFNDCGLRLLSYIFDLQANSVTNLFATSRPIPDIEGQFKTHLRREISATNEDVRTYLDGHMSDLPRCILNRPDIQEKIKTEIASAVEGMFLLAQLYLDSLKDKTSVKQIKSSLERFNKQNQLGLGEDKKRRVLEKAYEQAMDRINSQMPGFQVLGKKVLAWITSAKRRLTTLELQHALGVEVGSTELDPDNLPEIEDLISACAGLVTFDKESNVIRLVHYTTQEYFDRTRQDWFPDAEADITEVCITYLSFSIFESGCYQFLSREHGRLRSNPLYSYAAHNWGHHARAAPDKRLILDFLEDEAKASASYQALIFIEYGYHTNVVDEEIVSIHLAAYFGLMCMTSLLKNGHNVDFRDYHGRTPLSCAAAKGHEATVRLLLEHGADMEAEDNSCWTPISQAALYGHEDIVKLLHEKGANFEAKDNQGWTPLLLAIEDGHEAIVRLLLEMGADIKVTISSGCTPIYYAASHGHESIVRLLVERHADVGAADVSGSTPLHEAARSGYESTVRVLLEKGADIMAIAEYEGTPLHLAAKFGHESTVRLLLEKGADIDSIDWNYGDTALHLAATWGNESTVRLLLEKGADTSITETYFGHTPLQRAAEHGHESIVVLLEQHSR